MKHIPNILQTNLAASLGVVAVCVSVSWAQDSEPAPAPEPSAPPAATVPVELSISPTDLDSLGVRVFLPLDASAQTTIIPGGKAKTVITPDDQAWLIQMFVSISGNKSLTPTEALTGVVSQRRAQLSGPVAGGTGTGSLVREIGRVDNLVLAGMPASRAYVYEPMDQSVPVTGYTLVQVTTMPGRFLVIQLDCALPEFEKARAVYETVCAAAQFPATQELDTERSAAIMSGRTFLSSISPEEMDGALEPEPQFYRIFIPGSTDSPEDAREVGYQKIEIRKGQLGELDPNRDKAEWSVDEREFGYLVRVDARMLQNQWVFDSRAMFFLSLDKLRESWSILVEQKTGSSVSKSTQTLVRSGSRMTVRTERPGLAPEAKDYDLPEDQYLSAVERYMLPRILAQKVEPGVPALLDLAFYTFDTARGNVTLRRETFDRAPEGHWNCQTIPSEDQPSWTSTYTTEGGLISRLMPPLQVMEPTSAERIRKLWENKSLPIDD